MCKDVLLLIYVKMVHFFILYFGKPKIDSIFATNKNNYIKIINLINEKFF